MDHARDGERLLDRLPTGARVTLIRLRSLGDSVLTTPAISLLKAHRPDLHLTVIVEPRFAQIFAGNPDIDSISTSTEIVAHGPRPDLILNLHGGTRSMMMTAASFARFRAGFAHHRYSFVYSHKIPTAQQILGVDRPVHTAEHLASAMFWLGVPPSEIPRAKLAADAPRGFDRYAMIHPFASMPEKTWPAERFVEVARWLRGTLHIEPVFLAGPGDDAAAFSEFRTFKGSPLSEVKSLMAGAALFIGNDSGPAHVAAAFGVPVVVLFGPSNPVTWAPWRTESRVLTSRDNITSIPAAGVSSAIEALQADARASLRTDVRQEVQR